MSAFRDMPRRSLDPPPRRVSSRAAFRIQFGSYPSRIGWVVLALGLYSRAARQVARAKTPGSTAPSRRARAT